MFELFFYLIIGFVTFTVVYRKLFRKLNDFDQRYNREKAVGPAVAFGLSWLFSIPGYFAWKGLNKLLDKIEKV